MTIRNLYRLFKRFDANKNKRVDASELEQGLFDIGINLNSDQITVLMKHFDRDGSGTMNFDEFLNSMRVS